MLSLSALTHALAALAATLALMLGLVWLVQRYGPRFGLPITATTVQAQKRLQLIESLRLSPTLTIHLIHVDNTPHLLSVSQQNQILMPILAAPATATPSPRPAKTSKVKSA